MGEPANASDIDRLPLISADSHVEEPDAFFVDNLPASMHAALCPELRPRTEIAAEFGKRIGAVRGSDARFEEIARGRTNDPEGRFEVLIEDGIQGECIYPSRSLYVWNLTDPDVGRACCRIYNDWIHDILESRSPRFRCAGLIPTWRIPDALEELERIRGLGLAAAMLPLVGTPDYNLREWEPLWSAIEDSGLPVVMHQGTGHDMLFYRSRGAAVANLLATQSMAPRTAGLLATSGVLAEHPGLHFVFVETNAAWISWAMVTLDHYYDAFRQYEGWVRPVLEEKPGFYIARQLHGTFQVDPVAVSNIEHTGVEPLMWGSDFPHGEGTYPNSRSTVRRLFGGLDPEAIAPMVGGTAARLFDFAPEVLAEPVRPR
ncbi:MAG: amidohydrolase family protein [Proteobacteria bacterium]|nr:amidohydrolase family protein [Pseudomonadota bacterium]